MSEIDPPPWKDVIRVCLSALSTFLAFGMLLPIFPVWVEPFTDSKTMVGLVTTYSDQVPSASSCTPQVTRFPTSQLEYIPPPEATTVPAPSKRPFCSVQASSMMSAQLPSGLQQAPTSHTPSTQAV